GGTTGGLTTGAGPALGEAAGGRAAGSTRGCGPVVVPPPGPSDSQLLAGPPPSRTGGVSTRGRGAVSRRAGGTGAVPWG
ncbi:hypothetical protein, partial [Actinomadura roseirufa]|uniref:hypothetical protein n=1 Tax=Actinomadura roseirufa TaxID=2094049 RepID=UPI001A954781